MRKSNLKARVWLRISEESKKNLEESAKENDRTLGSEADRILKEHFNNKSINFSSFIKNEKKLGPNNN